MKFVSREDAVIERDIAVSIMILLLLIIFILIRLKLLFIPYIEMTEK